ncbi:hypothetical protein ACFU9F_24205 [Streptomyces zhihengii]|uniref:hypothetical protein n=1 Tax=Streptomyces zhihengii TaxID=1818004 RepID=UPI001FD54EFA|nr:hypothetical protein [Streptomyces zhihengii]
MPRRSPPDRAPRARGRVRGGEDPAGQSWHQPVRRREGGGGRSCHGVVWPMPEAEPERESETDTERRRRRAQFLRELNEAKALRDRVQPRRARAARMRQQMRMRTFRW